MRQEIERKFLVKDDFMQESVKSIHIAQGYLSSVPERTVRVRIQGESGFLTIKGESRGSGATRCEWETAIPLSDAKELLTLCEPGIIDKTRYIIPAANGRLWEVDQFHGDNDGLIVAEIELGSEQETFDKPAWLGEEVTGDPRYYNAALTKNPYKRWRK